MCLSLFIFSSNCEIIAENNDKQIKKEQEKRLQAAIDSVNFVNAMIALEKMEFSIGADRAAIKGGVANYVESNTNFINAHDGKAIVQLARIGSMRGTNGLGGITVEGNVSNIKTRTSKKGNFSLEFSVMGSAISARISIDIPKGSNYATATVYPNFNSDTLTIYGIVIPYSSTKTFQGHTL